MQGLVTKYYKKHGKNSYGFIQAYDGESYYFNSNSILSEVHEGLEVSFRGKKNGKGFIAFDVKACE